MAGFEDLKREVEETKTVVGSAVALIAGLRGRVDELQAIVNERQLNLPELGQLVADLDSAVAPLVAAVAASTPAAEQPAEQAVVAAVEDAAASGGDVAAVVEAAQEAAPTEPAPAE